MPTYEYRCRECGEELEVVQSFTDDALTECPACGGSLRKVFGSIGVTFKGSGFYKTDSRGSSSKSSSSPGSADTKTETKTETKSDTTSTSKSESSSSSSSSTKSDTSAA